VCQYFVMGVLDKTTSLGATRRRLKEEVDEDVSPADLLEAFDKCKKKGDDTVETT
jgi:hypothetical protein